MSVIFLSDKTQLDLLVSVLSYNCSNEIVFQLGLLKPFCFNICIISPVVTGCGFTTLYIPYGWDLPESNISVEKYNTNPHRSSRFVSEFFISITLSYFNNLVKILLGDDVSQNGMRIRNIYVGVS